MVRLVFAGILTITGMGIYLYFGGPDLDSLNGSYPFIQYRGPKTPFEVQIVHTRPRNWESLSRISPHAVEAILMSEDSGFYEHPGIEIEEIRSAIEEDLKAGRFKRGASTITQQVVKNVFLTSEKTIWRKIREIAWSLRLEELVPKQRILEIYLNIAEWGEGIFGIRAASQFYFQKTPRELTLKEGAFLAMLLPSPKKNSQSFRSGGLTPFAKRRIRSIVQKCIASGRVRGTNIASAMQSRLPFESLSASIEDGNILTGLDSEEGLEEPIEVPDQQGSANSDASPRERQETTTENLKEFFEEATQSLDDSN